MFFYIPREKLENATPIRFYGTSIEENFPSTLEEFCSAGKCIAFEENTAGVFHLMRIVDCGLRAVAASLQFDYDARNWMGIGKEITRRMEQKYQTKTDEWKKSEPFYASILVDIQALSRAHRNPVLHELERTYNEKGAEYIFALTENLIQHLADNGLREKTVRA